MCSSGGTGVKNSGQNRDSVRSTIITQQPPIRFYEWVRGKGGGSGLGWAWKVYFAFPNMDYSFVCVPFFFFLSCLNDSLRPTSKHSYLPMPL